MSSAIDKLADMAIAAAKAGAALVKDIVLGTTEAADSIAKMGKQLGVNTTDLQRLTGAIQLSGGDVSDLARGIRSLTVGLADAKTKGTGPAIEGLEALGLSAGQIEAILTEGNIEEALGVIGDAFNATGESAEKNAALLKLFGAKAGAQLRPLLESGSAAIRAMGDEIEATGSVLSEIDLKTFEDLNDTFLITGKQVDGVKQRIATALAPTIDDIAARFGVWVASNQDFIEQELPKLIDEALEVAQELLPIIIDIAKTTLDWAKQVKGLNDETGIFTTIFGTLFDITSAILDPVQTVLDIITAIVNTVLDLAAAIPGLEDTIESFRASLGLGKDKEVVVKFSEETTKSIKTVEEGFRKEAAKDKAAKTIGGLAESEVGAFRSLKPRRSRVQVLAEKIEDGAKLTKNERVEARALGLGRSLKESRRGGGGKGKARGKGGAPSFLDTLLGEGPARVSAGGGTKPLGGAGFTTIDQSFNAPTTIQITLPPGAAVDPEAIAEVVVRTIDTRNRQAFDHFRSIKVNTG